MTKKIAASLLAYAVLLHAAEFWSNVFTEWSEKDVQRMMESSPWAKKFDIALGGAPGANSADMFRPSSGLGATKTPGAAGGNAVGGAETVSLFIRWQSALPVKQARMRLKYGADVGKTPEAQEMLRSDEPNYLVAVEGLTGKLTGGADADTLKKMLMDQTALVVKGKSPIAPVDCAISGLGKVTAVFAFPKTTPISFEDKDVEFQSKVGTQLIKMKFHLKDMVYFDRLAL